MQKIKTSTLSRSELLRTPLCLLDLNLRKGLMGDCISQVKKELRERGLKIRLNFWISDEWFCPDGITGVAIPFYLLDERLIALETEYFGKAEGDKREYCLKLLRHEIGHAIDNAYNLRFHEDRQVIFGPSSLPYPKDYTRKPYSKSFVRNLDEHYAQAHPEEDWAETFATWLNPKSNWKNHYRDWPAIKKLNFMDKKMRSLIGVTPIVNNETLDEIDTLSLTIRTYLNRKIKNQNKYKAPLFGRNLNRIFETGSKVPAKTFLISKEKELTRLVARETKQYHYVVKDILKELKAECSSRNLTLKKSKKVTEKDILKLLSSSTKAYLSQGKNKVIM